MDKLPEQVWETYFARPDGEIPKMSKKLTDLCSRVVRIESKIDNLNGHDTIIKELGNQIEAQDEFCKAKQIREFTAKETLLEFEGRLEKVKEKERNRVLLSVAVGGFIVGILTLIFRLSGLL